MRLRTRLAWYLHRLRWWPRRALAWLGLAVWRAARVYSRCECENIGQPPEGHAYLCPDNFGEWKTAWKE